VSLWSRISSRLGRKNADPADPWLTEVWSNAGLSQAGVSVTASSAMRHTAVMACVSILAEDVAKIPFRVMRRTARGKREVPDHWLNQLLRRPNRLQTRMEFVEMMQAALVLRGNAYAPIIRNAQGYPAALYPVHPDRVSMMESSDGYLFYVVSRNTQFDRASLADLPMPIPAEDMFHLRWLSTTDIRLGSSRVQLMREAIGLAMSQEIMAGKVAGSGARPAGVLQTDNVLTQDVIDRLKASWQQNYGGLHNAGKTAILEQGLKWQALGMTLVDAEFMDSRRFSLEDILRGFRVPRHKVGLAPEGGAANLAQLDQEYINSVLSGYLERWSQRMELDFGLDEEGVFIEPDYAELGKTDIATRLNTARIGVLGMILTPNEAREQIGMAPVEGGDTLMQPTNMAEIGFAPPDRSAGGPGSDTTGAPAPGGDGDPARLPAA